MWIINFALLAVYGVLAGADDICAKGRPDICFPPDREPFEFPDSIETLNKICPILITRLNCLVDYQKKCGNKHPGTIEDKLDKVLEIVTDACDKDSELHNELSDNLPCLYRTIMSHGNSCRSIIEDAMDTIRSRILLTTGSDDPEDWRKYFCLYEALDFACFVADAGVTCGRATKEMVGRVMDRVGYLDVICAADVREEVKAMVEVIQVEFEEGLALKIASNKK